MSHCYLVPAGATGYFGRKDRHCMELGMEAATGNTYRVAHSYADKGNPHLAGDEFSGWLAINGRTIGMTGGIRPRSYLHKMGTRLPVKKYRNLARKITHGGGKILTNAPV